jgi:selenide, water dikinase
LVGFTTNDDAGVYRLDDQTAIVTTADFITPPVNDPYLYGQIAAANALSDVYAMGGRPLTCLNLVAFPSSKLNQEVLNGIIAGALSKITEAGAVLAGGHSIEDDEPKFGLAVTGIVHPDRYWLNSGARPGDALILTKPLGSGVLFNANLKNWVSEAALKACCDALSQLNRHAAETLSKYSVHAATDITGFGLSGHAMEMAAGSRVTLEIDVNTLPLMDEALDMYRRGMSTGVNHHNRQLVAAHTHIEVQLPAWHEEILFDPQTSGGLLVAVPDAQCAPLVKDLHANGVTRAVRIGRAVALDGNIFLHFT